MITIKYKQDRKSSGEEEQRYNYRISRIIFGLSLDSTKVVRRNQSMRELSLIASLTILEMFAIKKSQNRQ